MVDYSAPLRAAQQGLMTGVQLGGRMRENRQNREIGGLMAGGDYAGASAAAFTGGDLRTGQAIQGYEREQQGVQRGQNITGALKTGDYAGAMGFASSPEEMAQITAFRDRATAAEKAQAAEKAGQMAAVLGAIQSLPPEQQLAAAQEYAPQFGIDPAGLTAETLTPQALEAYRIQAIGLKDYLSYQDRREDNARQDRVAEAQIAATRSLGTQREASANAANARAAKTRSAPSGGRSGGRQSAPSAAPAARPWERKW
jgi:hypothetical protein